VAAPEADRRDDDLLETVSTRVGGKMTYSITYNDGLASVTQETRGPASTRIEIFPTEGEALSRASRLLDEGTHQAISVCDGSGNVLCGVRLQLKLGFSTE